MDREMYLTQAQNLLTAHDQWVAEWGGFEPDETLQVDPVNVSRALTDLAGLLRENYPYPHPRYAGQMLKPPHPVASLAYLAAMQINPNNHALDGGLATSKLEKQIVPKLAAMFGLPEEHLGHLTASGTIANLEALWIARSIHPDKAIASCEQAHYTHERVSGVLRAKHVTIRSDSYGRIDLDHLQSLLDSGEIGTVVATAGTTGLGAVDAIQTIRAMTAEAGVRLHVDAAYGGFFTLIAGRDGIPGEPFRAIGEADSVVVDPHKHGLQPYGCGAVIFRDPAVGRYYQHDSPYTYFTSDELHLGEISLECSRAGAAAAALWATLECFPLEAERGFGPMLARCHQAAVDWAGILQDDERWRLVLEPELDILNFFAIPSQGETTASRISQLTEHTFQRAMDDPDDPLYLATLRVDRGLIEARYPEVIWDQPSLTVFRSVLMKPEHASWTTQFHETLSKHLAAVEGEQ